MTLKFVIILQNLIKAYHRKSGKSKYDRKLTELDVETTRIRSRVMNGVLISYSSKIERPDFNVTNFGNFMQAANAFNDRHAVLISRSNVVSRASLIEGNFLQNHHHVGGVNINCIYYTLKGYTERIKQKSGYRAKTLCCEFSSEVSVL